MQGVIEELVRWFGYAALRVLTFGRYRGGTEEDRVAEGAIGLAIVLLIAYVVYAVSSSST